MKSLISQVFRIAIALCLSFLLMVPQAVFASMPQKTNDNSQQHMSNRPGEEDSASGDSDISEEESASGDSDISEEDSTSDDRDISEEESNSGDSGTGQEDNTPGEGQDNEQQGNSNIIWDAPALISFPQLINQLGTVSGTVYSYNVQVDAISAAVFDSQYNVVSQWVQGKVSSDGNSFDWSVDLSDIALDDGLYTIRAKAFNNQSEIGVSPDLVGFEIDKTLPTVTIVAVSSDGTVLSMSNGENVEVEFGTIIKVTVSDNEDIAKVMIKCKVDELVHEFYIGDVSYEHALTLPGVHEMTVSIWDTAGNKQSHNVTMMVNEPVEGDSGNGSNDSNDPDSSNDDSGDSSGTDSNSDSSGNESGGSNSSGNGRNNSSKNNRSDSRDNENQIVVRVRVDEQEYWQTIKYASNRKTAVLKVDIPFSVIKVDLPESIINQLAGYGINIKIETELGGYKVPAKALQQQLDNIAKEWGSETEQMKVIITAKELDNVQLANFDRAVQALKGEMVIQPLEYIMEIYAGDQTTEVQPDYAERMFDLTENKTLNRIHGVVLRNGRLQHAPLQLVNEDGKVRAVLLSKTNNIYSLIKNEAYFADTTGHWAENTINLLANKLIVTGVGNEYFLPAGDLTRAEFLALLVRTLGLEENAAAANFSDISLKEWYSGAIGAAVDAGLVSGYPDGTFKPNTSIALSEISAIINRVVDPAGYNGANDNNMIMDIPTNSLLDVKDNITRAQGAVVIQRLLDKINMI